MSENLPGVIGLPKTLCAVQWCGAIARVYPLKSPMEEVASFDLDPFPENISETVDRLEEVHNIRIINFDREAKKILL